MIEMEKEKNMILIPPSFVGQCMQMLARNLPFIRLDEKSDMKGKKKKIPPKMTCFNAAKIF